MINLLSQYYVFVYKAHTSQLMALVGLQNATMTYYWWVYMQNFSLANQVQELEEGVDIADELIEEVTEQLKVSTKTVPTPGNLNASVAVAQKLADVRLKQVNKTMSKEEHEVRSGARSMNNRRGIGERLS